MTPNNYTPIASGADANDTTFNAPLGQLDAAIGAAVATLTTAAKTLVGAAIELDADVGVPAGLTTVSKIVVGAINEVNAFLLGGGSVGGAMTVTGNVTATAFIGNGAGLTGIGTGTGGVINTGSTTVGADSGAGGTGVIALQTRGITHLTLENNGSLTIVGGAQGPAVSINNAGQSNYIEFNRNGHTVRGAVGALGNFEMNLSYNMDYADGVHRYYDSSLNAFWFAMNTNGVYLQYAPSGLSPDIWTNAGAKYLWAVDSSGNETLFGNLSVGVHNASFSTIDTGTTLNYLTLDSKRSIIFNIDSDNDSTGEVFVWAANRTAFTGGIELMRLTEAGKLTFAGDLSVGILNATYSTIDAGATANYLVLNSRRNILFNIDSDDTEVTSSFMWATNRVALTGGAELMRLNEVGSLLLGTITDGMTAAGSLAIAQDLAHRGAKVGFYNGAPVVRGAALTAQLTTVTYTAPGTPDYSIQDFTQTTPWGFASHDEANSILKVIENLQIRCAQLEARLGSATGVNIFA